MNILQLFKPIKTFVFDVDGVLTDGSLLVLPNGVMARRMNIKDGYALQLAVRKGYHVVIISGGNSEEVKERLNLLGVQHVFMKVGDKVAQLNHFLKQYRLDPQEALFMGDDMPDLAALQTVGLACCPADAANDIKEIAHYISPFTGGTGCARDVIEKVLKLNNHWDEEFGIKAM